MPPHPGTPATIAFDLVFIAFVLLSLGLFIGRLWWRSRHPLEGPGSVEEALADDETEGEDWR